MKKFTLILFFLVLFLGMTDKLSAQKYEVTGNESTIIQATEITLSGSTVDKFYYLFRIDQNGDFQFVTFMTGQGKPLNYAPQNTAGKYVICEFDDFKEMPFNFEKYKPEDGMLQIGEVILSSENNN